MPESDPVPNPPAVESPPPSDRPPAPSDDAVVARLHAAADLCREQPSRERLIRYLQLRRQAR